MILIDVLQNLVLSKYDRIFLQDQIAKKYPDIIYYKVYLPNIYYFAKYDCCQVIK